MSAAADEKKGPALPGSRRASDVKAGQVVEPLSVGAHDDRQALDALGYKPELRRNRSMYTLLFQSLAIAAIPYGFGGPMISAIYGGGQLAMFVGWLVVLAVDECVAVSLGELASRYPTSAGPYYWSFQAAGPRYRRGLSFVTGWAWLVGNWTVTLSVNFGFASMLAAAVALYYPAAAWPPWQLILVFYAVCLLSFVIVAFGNRFLPTVDAFCAAFTAVTILVTCVCVSVTADVGRHSLRDTLAYYDTTLSGWGNFSFLIGTLPSVYTFSAMGMICSMAEECGDPTLKLPRALALCVPVGGIAGLFFILPLCATLPALADIVNEAPLAQALPYVYGRVMGSPGAALGLTVLVLVLTLFCSVSITVAASRCTWAFARDGALPGGARVWARIDARHGTPIRALALLTAVEMLLGLIYLGSSTAFNAFVSVGVIALALSYGIPIAISMGTGRRGVRDARWTVGPALGWLVNAVALTWIAFEVVLFSMPTAIPVTGSTMNYAAVVLVSFMTLSAIWYAVHARKVYKGPPESDGLTVAPH